MSEKVNHFPVQVYYEDTDHSGVVYHANYFKYFERAREDTIGIKTLTDLWYEKGLGFAIYKAEISYHEGAIFGDTLDIRTTWKKDGDYKIIFYHEVWRPEGKKAAVSCSIELVCLGPNKQLKPIPDLDFMK